MRTPIRLSGEGGPAWSSACSAASRSWPTDVSDVLGSTREAALLADLIVHAGEVVPASRLIDDLWRGEPPRGGPGTLQTYVKNLRRMLEPNRPSGAPSEVLVSRRPGYVLNVAADGLDAWRCERLIDEGRAALGSR